MRLSRSLRFRGLLLGIAGADFRNLHASQFPTVADRAVIAFPAAIFESDDLLVLALLDDFTCDRRTLDERGAVGQVLAISEQQNIREDTFFTDFSIQEVHVDDVTFCDAMLSAAGFDNCECHGLEKVGKSHTAGPL